MPVYNNFQRNAFNQMVPASRRRLHNPLERPGLISGSEWNDMYGPFGRKAQGADTPLGRGFAYATTNQDITGGGFLKPDYFVPQSLTEKPTETWRSAFAPDDKFDTFEQAMSAGKLGKDSGDLQAYKNYAASFGVEPSTEGFNAYRQEKEGERVSERKAMQANYQLAQKQQAERFDRALAIWKADQAVRQQNQMQRERAWDRNYREQKGNRDWELSERNKRQSALFAAGSNERDPARRAALRQRLVQTGASPEIMESFDTAGGSRDYYTARDLGRSVAQQSGTSMGYAADYIGDQNPAAGQSSFAGLQPKLGSLNESQRNSLQHKAAGRDSYFNWAQNEAKILENEIARQQKLIDKAGQEVIPGTSRKRYLPGDILEMQNDLDKEINKKRGSIVTHGSGVLQEDGTRTPVESLFTPKLKPRWGTLDFPDFTTPTSPITPGTPQPAMPTRPGMRLQRPPRWEAEKEELEAAGNYDDRDWIRAGIPSSKWPTEVGDFYEERTAEGKRERATAIEAGRTDEQRAIIKQREERGQAWEDKLAANREEWGQATAPFLASEEDIRAGTEPYSIVFEAMQLFDAGDYLGAKDKAEEALRLDPKGRLEYFGSSENAPDGRQTVKQAAENILGMVQEYNAGVFEPGGSGLGREVALGKGSIGSRTPGTEAYANREQQESIQAEQQGSIQAATLVQDGKLLYEKTEYPAAQDALLEALRLDPENQGARHYLGLVQEELARTTESESVVSPLGAVQEVEDVTKDWVSPTGLSGEEAAEFGIFPSWEARVAYYEGQEGTAAAEPAVQPAVQPAAEASAVSSLGGVQEEEAVKIPSIINGYYGGYSEDKAANAGDLTYLEAWEMAQKMAIELLDQDQQASDPGAADAAFAAALAHIVQKFNVAEEVRDR